MSNSRNPIIQHWVPRFYLRYFATYETFNVANGQRVWLWDKQKKVHTNAPTSVRNVLGARHLYSPETPDGQRDWTAEKLLDETETAAGAIWPNLITGQLSLRDPAVRKPIARFIGLLHLRNVRLRDLIQSTMKLRDELFGALTPEQIASRDADMPDPNHPGRFFSHAVINGDEKMTKIFDELNWFVFCAEKDVFITTDCPVQFLQGGPGRPNSAAVCPLSPRLLLVMQNIRGPIPHDFIGSPLDKCLIYNKDLYAGCNKFMITGRPIRTVLQELDVEVAS